MKPIYFKIAVISLLVILVGSIVANIIEPEFTTKYILPISKTIGVLSVAVGIWVALGDYKNRTESVTAENDVKILNLFTQTFDIVHGRRNTIMSEMVIEKLFDKEVIKQNEFDNIDVINKKLELATRNIPVGLASQIAAIGAVGELGSKYKLLREAALQGLKNFKEQTQQDAPQITPIGNYIQAAMDKINKTK